MSNLIKTLPIILGLASSLALAAPSIPMQDLKAPKDPGVINKERIEYWMKARGQIDDSMSKQEIEQKVNQYASRAHAGVLPDLPKVVLKPSTKQVQSINAEGNMMTKTVNVLSVLIDFPDLKNDDNGLSSSDTAMYYSSYPVSHYQALQFSPTGFDGPSGQNLLSGYQYYQAESGGTFFFSGTTYGWVRADNNHDYYGGNDADNDDNDKNAGALVTEAVNKAFANNTIDLSEFDIEDQFDIDGDGNVNEPDGFIDHVMVYHSSVGEEAGGGVAGNSGDDAIWSHRFFVNPTSSWATRGASITGSEYQTGVPYRVFGYTIQPIDAATGVVAHEFGHDLGLPDEYDTKNSDLGEPVASWSIMSAGSWAGTIPGTEPTGFSADNRDYLQRTYDGDWIDELTVDFATLNSTGTSIDLVEAVNHSGTTNQVKMAIPIPAKEGSGFYYSQAGNEMSNSVSFPLEIPTGTSIQLSMQGIWQIEEDYDYALVKVNGNAVAGNHTIAGPNQYYASVRNYISNNSIDIDGSDAQGWVDLTFDLSAYAGQTVTISIDYITDLYEGGFGIGLDDIELNVDGNIVYTDNADDDSVATFSGFDNATGIESGKAYYIQLRSHNGVDVGLKRRSYEPGIVLWYENASYSDNNVDDHPGYGFIGVVDADQVLNTIRTDSRYQVRDAAFSLFTQTPYTGDTSLTPVSSFDDANDYSSPSQPESGLILPELGLSFEVTAQADDSSTATILLKRTLPEPEALTASFSQSTTFRTVMFTNATTGGTESYTYAWDFGDGTLSTDASPTHTYAASGVYTVSLVATDSDNSTSSFSTSITIAEALQAAIETLQTEASVTVNASSTGGSGDVSYTWNFGDGSTGSGAVASHTYTESGTYTITLNAESSGDNQSSTVTDSVEIYISPSANFTSSVSDLTATFNNTSTGGAGTISYSWNFGDGGSSSSTSASHTYAEAGSYAVTLTMTDGENNTSTLSKTVTVTKPKKSGGGGSMGLFLIFALFSSALTRIRKSNDSV